MASRPLESLFYAGAHGELLKATIDSTSGQFEDEDLFLVVGALVFTGRTDEAAVVFRSWQRAARATEHDVELAVACRFFLCIAECRAGRYGAAEKLCRASLAELRGHPSPRARYFLHQGLGLLRHFTGRIASAARHASRARRHAVEARFTYGRMLALDLLGHTLVHRGKVLSGLTVLAQAVELAEGIGLTRFALTTRSALVAYSAHFGAGSPNPCASLLEHLAHVGDTDRYSKRLILTELAKAHAFRGEADAAAREIRRAEDVALPDGDRRATVKLHLARALVAGLSHGEAAADEWLAQARGMVDAGGDAALDVEIAWYEYLVTPATFALRDREALVTAARTTGIARADYLAAARGAERGTLAGEDRFAATIRAIRQDDGSGLGLILAHELYGLVPLCFGRTPGLALYLDAQRAFFAIESHGNVTCREPPSPALCMLLRALVRGARTKEDLIREVWRLNVYRPTKHDAVVHTAVSRLRTALEPHASWIVIAGAGYGLAPGVAVVEVGEASDAPGVEMPDEGGAPSAPPPPLDAPDPRRAAALALIERAEGAATRDIAEALKISEMTAFRVLGALVDEGLIERTGRGRSTRYIRCR